MLLSYLNVLFRKSRGVSLDNKALNSLNPRQKISDIYWQERKSAD